MNRSDHHTVQEILDGTISQDDFDRFQQRLREHPELARLYGDYALLNHALHEEFEDKPVSAAAPALEVMAKGRSVLWLAAAVVLALVAGGLVWKRSPGRGGPAQTVTNVWFSEDAVWQIEGKSDRRDLLQAGDTLRLLRGEAEYAPFRYARAVLEGPSTLLVVSPEALYLAHGAGRFRMDDPKRSLKVSTRSMTAEDAGTSFGVLVPETAPDELHVFDGKVRMRINGRPAGVMLVAGQAGRVSGADGIEEIPANRTLFPTSLAKFETIVGGKFVNENWRVDYGSPLIGGSKIDGENFTAYLRLPQPEPSGNQTVLLATLTVAKPANGEFHTDGWAGISFFSGGRELLFFGDSFGPERTWSLDVKQRVPVIIPANPLVGPATVTLRFDRATGDVSLHEGTTPLRAAFCTGRLPPGSTFDEIRLGASTGAALAVESLTLRAGGQEN